MPGLPGDLALLKAFGHLLSQFVDLLEQLVHVFTLVAVAEDLVDRVTDLMVEMVGDLARLDALTNGIEHDRSGFLGRRLFRSRRAGLHSGCWVEGELVSTGEGCCVAGELLGCGDR